MKQARMSYKEENLRAAEAWWMTEKIWHEAGFMRIAENFHMWLCLFAWAGMPVD